MIYRFGSRYVNCGWSWWTLRLPLTMFIPNKVCNYFSVGYEVLARRFTVFYDGAIEPEGIYTLDVCSGTLCYRKEI